MDLVVVTGMSGAGKTQVINALEDLGYYCVDNVPPRLLSKFAELSDQSEGKISKIALVVDVRSKNMFNDYLSCLEGLDASQYNYKTVFLDCETKTLITRYKETRRRHPLLSSTGTMEKAIQRERDILQSAKEHAHYVIDTTLNSSTQTKNRIRDLFSEGVSRSMSVNCTSFGFKYGVPSDADLVFDVRCLPNPFYIEELRDQTGLDAPVREYVLSFPQAQGLIPKLLDLIDYLVPLYMTEGKSQLVVAIGCTGGKHRSVTFTELLAAHLIKNNISASINHRDIQVRGR